MMSTFWKEKSVLVTGGSGFVGRWVGRRLQHLGARLQILDLAPPKNYEVPFVFHETDLRNLEATAKLLERARPHVVIHLAGQPGVQSSHDHPVGAFEANTLCTFNLLEASRQLGGIEAILAVSSNHVYGDQHQIPTPEDAPLNGTGMYAVSKLCGDVLARTYGKTYGLPVGIARMTNSYGPDDHHTSHIITATILSCLRGEAPVIKQSGRDRKGYLYIEDTAAGLLAITKAVALNGELHGEAFNLVPDEALTVLELVQEITRQCGVTTPATVLRPDAHAEEEHLANAKVSQRVGFRPPTSFQDGIAKTIAWYRSQLAHPAKV